MKSRLPFPIIYEDRDLIVISKPAGLLTTNTRLVGRLARESQLTAENWLNDYVRKGQLKSKKCVYLVHRLDRDTSGVMMFAKSAEVAESFRANWNQLTEKVYIAKVEGEMSGQGVFESYLYDNPKTMKVSSVTDAKLGKLSRTEWEVVSFDGKFSTLKVYLKSGRKNQIRVHFSENGHPVVGDIKYGAKKSDRLYLHALTLKIKHPHTSKWLEFNDDCDFL